MNYQKTSVRQTIIQLSVGESVTYDLERLKSIRTQASELGAVFNRKYTTKTNREARTLTVTRIA